MQGIRFVIGAALGFATACSGLVDVSTPGVINGDTIDPLRDGRILSLSARQNFAIAYGQFILYGAWFSGEAWSAETQPAPSEFERRDVTAENGDLLTLWTSLSVARETSEKVVAGLSGTPGASTNVDLARAALYAGYSYESMAEYFCQGTASAGPLLDRPEMLRRAITYFATAHVVGDAASRTGSQSDRAEAAGIATGALVGSARARLQSGDRSDALTDAQNVSPTFVLWMLYSNDPANLARLSNTLWFHTALRATLSVAPAFRNLNDPRVAVQPPTAAFPAFDGVTELWTQRKYPAYESSIPLASGMEARYIAAEAKGLTAMLALIQERRAANGLGPYSGETDSIAVTREFLRQRSREFFLEGKRLGDIARYGELVPDLPQHGASYHKAGFPPIGDQTCWPLPAKETSRLRP